MTLLVRRIRSVEPEVNLLIESRKRLVTHPLPQTTLRLTEMHGESQYNKSISWVNPEHAKVSSFVPWPDIKYRKIFQVPARFCRQCQRPFARDKCFMHFHLCLFFFACSASRLNLHSHHVFFFAHFTWKNMLLTRLRRATPFVVTGLVGSAALYGYKARFLEQGRKRELLYFWHILYVSQLTYFPLSIKSIDAKRAQKMPTLPHFCIKVSHSMIAIQFKCF